MDVQTRRLRYFVAVAEERHFSKAAARLFVAQQAVSKQIRDLENDLGTRLFDRHPRSVELTPAGEAFLRTARSILGTLDSGVDLARRLGSGERDALRVGFIVGGALELGPAILAEFETRFPEVRLELRESPLGDPSGGLADGSVDVAFVRLPIGLADLQTVPLFTEPVVVGVSRRHKFAHRTSLRVSDLVDETIAVARTPDHVWRDYWSLTAFRQRPAPRVVASNSHTEELSLVAAGMAINVTPAGAARCTAPGVVFLPIEDGPDTELVVAWRAGSVSALVRQFGDVAAEVRDRETEITGLIEQPPYNPSANHPHPVDADRRLAAEWR